MLSLKLKIMIQAAIVDDHNVVADRICRSFDTVRSYRKALYIKLNAHSTRELISKAVEAGLV